VSVSSSSSAISSWRPSGASRSARSMSVCNGMALAIVGGRRTVDHGLAGVHGEVLGRMLVSAKTMRLRGDHVRRSRRGCGAQTTTRTSHGACRNAFSAVEPKSARVTCPEPVCPTTMSAACSERATLMSASAGSASIATNAATTPRDSRSTRLRCSRSRCSPGDGASRIGSPVSGDGAVVGRAVTRAVRTPSNSEHRLPNSLRGDPHDKKMGSRSAADACTSR
jgi:hypothetical protein